MSTHNQKDIDVIPNLSSLSDLYYKWKSAVTTYLQFNDCLDVTHGLYAKPYRVPPEVDCRTRAGSVAPEGTTSTMNRTLRVKECEERRAWARRENRAQAALKATVSEGMRQDIEDLPLAHDMWLHISESMEAGLLEDRDNV